MNNVTSLQLIIGCEDENEYIEIDLNEYNEKYKRLQKRIDKAIEYIETWCYDEYSIAIKTGDKTCSSESKAIDKLLDILKGSDKE